jgi:hypothetical protein
VPAFSSESNANVRIDMRRDFFAGAAGSRARRPDHQLAGANVDLTGLSSLKVLGEALAHEKPRAVHP